MPDAALSLQAQAASPAKENACEAGWLAGFGSSRPITAENYTAGKCTAWQGQAMAILRSGYEPGNLVLKVRADGLPDASLEIRVE